MTRASFPALVLLALASTARAQQAPSAPTPAPAPPPPVVAPSPAPATPAPLPTPAPAPAPPPATPAPPPPSAPGNAPETANEGPPAYYFEPPVPGQPNEPRPPYYGPRLIWEPPPPPVPRHLAPSNAFWLGGRVGWFVPLGNVYSRGTLVGSGAGAYVQAHGVAWSRYASSGPMFELDAGARLGRHYNLFALWERTELGSGDGNDISLAGANGGDSDFWGVGVRASSNPDRVGFLTEFALGYRRARSNWDDGTELQLTQSVFEARVGLGADVRVNRYFSLSPLLTLGVGSFGRVRIRYANGDRVNALGPYDDYDGHASFTFQLGAHFDLTRR